MYAVVDIETTGSRFGQDRITEIAVYMHDGEQLKDSWTTLVNPEIPIPAFISRLTGINDEMVKDAPVFGEVADKLHELLHSRIFVAHNVGFDYGFIRSEFERTGLGFHAKRLCTVRLSRKVFPGMHSYSLGKLCRERGIKILDRHRAFGDAQATAVLFDQILKADRKGHIQSMLKRGTSERNLPSALPKKQFDRLPQTAGVYYFHNSRGKVIYVGKAKNIKKRVASHFASAENSAKSAQMRHCIHGVSCIETGNELIALLTESLEIKRHDPVFNAAQRRWAANYAIISYEDRLGYLRLGIEKYSRRKPVEITFAGVMAARHALLRNVRAFGLCAKLCGLQRGTGDCSVYIAEGCGGACKGTEKSETYNEKVRNAIASMQSEYNNVLLIGPGRNSSEMSVVGIEDGHYLGYGYYDPSQVSENALQIKDFIKSQPDNPDVQRILQAYLRSSQQDHELVIY